MELTEMNMIVTDCIVFSTEGLEKNREKFLALAKKTNTVWNVAVHKAEGVFIFIKVK